MKLYIVCNARMPSKKAYGIQVAKMCEALIEQGTEVELVIPCTHVFKTASSIRGFYRLRVEVPTVALYAPDWYSKGQLGFTLGSLVFMITSAVYLLSQRLRGRRGVVYAVDMDRFSFLSLFFSGMPYVVELDGMPALRGFAGFILRRAKGVVAINTEVGKDLVRTFSLAKERVLAAPNGVDAKWFEDITKQDARAKLNLPQDKRIAAYVGRFYEWKGLGILADVSERLGGGNMLAVVGGSTEEFTRATSIKNIPSTLHMKGECESYEVPLWLAAADALVILGTKHNEMSYRYTAPMKVYEYMLSRRPIVASDVPSLRAIIPQDEVLWYAPDEPEDLTKKLELALESSEENRQRAERAYTEALAHTWEKRARLLMDFITTGSGVH